jgi:hypothetical protein
MNDTLTEINPYEMSIAEQLASLRRANDEEKWGITGEDFLRLALTAPVWPEGKHAFRSFRLRFGEGDDGVAKTFECHVTRIRHVFGESGFWRWEYLHSGKVEYKGKPVERLRLLNGNHTHKACVEWIVADLDTHRERKSIEAVRDANSLADELLVITWLFADMVRAIDYSEFPGLFGGGYEVNVPELSGGAWRVVVSIRLSLDRRLVRISAFDRGDNDSSCSVPVLRESPARGA